MRIALVNQFFWPDLAPTGQYLYDLARYLSDEGHDVTVICSKGIYAEGNQHEGTPPNLRTIRIPGFVHRSGAPSRLISYSWFFVGAFWYLMRIKRQDLIVSMTTPPLLAASAGLVKALRGTRHYIWEMDLFPHALVALGVLRRKGIGTSALSCIQNWARGTADGIIVLGPCMRDRLLADGISPAIVHVAENWADGAVVRPLPQRFSSFLNVLYSGNLGLAHELSTIVGAIEYFRKDARIVFTFAGGGVGRAKLEKHCASNGYTNVRFRPYVHKDQMSRHLGECDLGLVTQLPESVGTVVPSKIYSLLAAGRPILFIGPRAATAALLIERHECGWQVDPGATEELIILLKSLMRNPALIARRGRNARTAFETAYDRPLGVARVAAALGVAGRATQLLEATCMVPEPSTRVE